MGGLWRRQETQSAILAVLQNVVLGKGVFSLTLKKSVYFMSFYAMPR